MGEETSLTTEQLAMLPSDPAGIKKEKRRIMKNVFLISVAFLFNFNAFQGLSRLQSSLHKDEGMGVINSSVLYGALVLSCLFVPKILISQIGHKWTIPLSFCGYILWMAANGYAVWGTMITASIIVGLCAAPLWTAQCSYFTKIGSRYAVLNEENEQAVLSRFFGIFFMFFQMSSILGSVISSTVLKDPVRDNETLSEDDVIKYCGGNDCPGNNVSNPLFAKPDSKTVWTMLGIYIAIAVLAVLIVILFVDRLPKELRDDKKQARKEACQLAASTLKHLRHKYQLLLIPITMYSGFEQAFYNAEWSKSFITCSVGIWQVGLITLPFGVVNAIVSFTGGTLVKYIGRLPIFLLGMCVDLCIQFTLMFWAPIASHRYVMYILSGMWGLTDGIWQTQINALYGCIFTNESEAAFSNYRMWESVGFIIAFAYSTFLCTSVKIYVLTGVLAVGMVLYLVVEYMIHVEKKNNPPAIADATSGTKQQGPPPPYTDDSYNEKYAYQNPDFSGDNTVNSYL